MSLSRDDRPDSKPAPKTRTEPEKPVRDKPSAEPDAASGDLAQDLDVVQRGKPERAFNVGAVLGVALTAAAAIFMFQNRHSVEFDWLWFTFSLPVWIALLGGVVAGVVLTLTVFAVHVRRQGRIDRRSAAAGRLRRALTRSRHVPKQA